MDFMKVFDQTVRELKREVNLKVLKVPEMEQKVLDATDNEPWGPHGSALAEIAQATKRFSECQMVMNVLWTRLSETGRDWRHVYKSLAVIEYLVANGSESAVTDIIEHTFKISSLSSFEYVEPNGKDVGINVRKKVETIVALLNDKDKIQEVRSKASANRDKYVGLSSSGIAFKSSSVSQSSSSFSSEGYGGFGGARGGDMFKDTNKDTERFGEEKFEKYTPTKSRQGKTSKKGSTGYGSKDQDTLSSELSKPSIPPQSASGPSISHDEDFDDFDPRGTFSSKPTAGSSSQVDLFGQSLVDDLMDLPTSLPTETPAMSSNSSEADLFIDADFVSAPPHEEAAASSQSQPQPQPQVDLFASQPAFPPAFSSPVDFFAAPDPVSQHKTKTPDPVNNSAVDPFAAVPLNSFDESEPFGSFTSHTDSVSTEPSHDGNLNNLNGKSLGEFNAPPKKNAFQVKSGIWADSLSRGLIDLNISAPKKVSLTEVGIVGGLSDGSAEKEKAPPTAAYMGRAMGAGSGLGRSGISSSTSIGSGDGDNFFSSLSTQQYQFGSFQK